MAIAWKRHRLKSSSVTSGCFIMNSRIIAWASGLPSRAIRSMNRLRSSVHSVSFSLQTRVRASRPSDRKSCFFKEWTSSRKWCTHSVLFRSSRDKGIFFKNNLMQGGMVYCTITSMYTNCYWAFCDGICSKKVIALIWIYMYSIWCVGTCNIT